MGERERLNEYTRNHIALVFINITCGLHASYGRSLSVDLLFLERSFFRTLQETRDSHLSRPPPPLDNTYLLFSFDVQLCLFSPFVELFFPLYLRYEQKQQQEV
jgi:hypothetical protein